MPRSKRVKPLRRVDPETFRPEIDTALAAFAIDLRYAAEICRRAKLIVQRRERAILKRAADDSGQS